MPADYRNDAVHPTLGRAHPLQQATLDGQGPGRSAYGRCAVLESSGGGGLTDFTMGDSVSGECWSVNPYSGCAHACSYCYVPDTVHAERVRWGQYVVVKRDLPTQLARAVQKRDKRTVYFSTATDPYQPAEREHRITRKCLEVLARRDWPVEVLTRSPLVLRDLDLLQQFSQVRVGMSVPTLDDRLRKVLEPSAPPIEARLRTLRKLSGTGLKVFANYTPAAPPTTHGADAIADAFLDAGVHWVNSKGLQRPHTILAPLWERLRGTEWEEMTRFFSSGPRQAAWQEELGTAFRRVGLPLSVPFFNPPFEWLQEPLPAARQARLDEVRVTAVPRLPAAPVEVGMPLPVLRVR